MKRYLLCALAMLLMTSAAFAGGPMLIGSPSLPNDGQPLIWNPATMPITYTVDPGPLSQTPAGTVVIDNRTGVATVDKLFNVWHTAPDAALIFSNLGPIKPSGAYLSGDVDTVAEYNALEASCSNGDQNPIVFDADGSLFSALGYSNLVIGFAGPCAVDFQGHIVSGHAALNGRFQDGIDNGDDNRELTASGFEAAFIHEFGHFLGLDHSQINVNCLINCREDADSLEGLPTMFPIAISGANMNVLHTDDLSWISKLYPKTSFNTNYGKISGTIYFSDGITPAQGVNVIARRVNDPGTSQDESRIYAVSAVSGYRFTSNPGQSLTEHYLPCSPATDCPHGYASNNVDGSFFGSRLPTLYGYYEMWVPPGSYTIEVESINRGFSSGSSVGPLDPPVPMPGGVKEFWDAGESATDAPSASTPVTVPAGGEVKDINIILNNTRPRNDSFETGWLHFPVQFANTECEVRG